MNRHRPPHLVSLAGALVALAWLLLAPPAGAQTDRPGLDEALLRRHGTRHVLPFAAPAGAADAAASLRATNTGWGPTQILAVELSPGHEGASAERVLAVHCRQDLPRLATAELPLSGQDAIVLVYSLDPERVPDACAAFAPVRRGEQELGEWEAGLAARAAGQPLAVLGQAEAGDALARMAGLTALDLPPATAARIEASQALAAVPVAGQGRLRVFNPSAAGQVFDTRIGYASNSADCNPPVPAAPGGLGAYHSRDTLSGGWRETGALGLLRAGRGPADLLQLTTAIDHRSDDLWLRHAASTLSSPDSRILAFPLALSPQPESQTELWVTNAHVTATIQVALAMSDGNGQVLRNYNDPVGLCPGATRAYDVLDLAGEIPPTGRGGNQPPYLSLRVEGVATELGEFAPIAGSLILRSPAGSFAYPGLNLPFEAALLRPRRDQLTGETALAAVLPGLELRRGPERRTSFVAIAGLGGSAGDNLVTIDFYDEAGRLVVGGFQRPIRPVGFFDLGQVALRDGGGQRLPDGFVGTAVIRGQRNPGAAFGALAVSRPTSSDRPDAPPAAGPVLAHASQLLRLWPDPAAPTPTPAPTRAQATATPERPTATPTPDEPTPTPGEGGRRIWLPALLGGGGAPSEG